MAKRASGAKNYVDIDDMSAKMSDAESHFILILRVLAPDLLQGAVRELQFAKDAGRRWRMDFAWQAQRVYVEIDGGTWTGGRHTRGAGIEQDAEKENAAAAQGWRRLRFTPQMYAKDPQACVDILRKVLELGNENNGE